MWGVKAPHFLFIKNPLYWNKPILFRRSYWACTLWTLSYGVFSVARKTNDSDWFMNDSCFEIEDSFLKTAAIKFLFICCFVDYSLHYDFCVKVCKLGICCLNFQHLAMIGHLWKLLWVHYTEFLWGLNESNLSGSSMKYLGLRNFKKPSLAKQGKKQLTLSSTGFEES